MESMNEGYRAIVAANDIMTKQNFMPNHHTLCTPLDRETSIDGNDFLQSQRSTQLGAHNNDVRLSAIIQHSLSSHNVLIKGENILAEICASQLL